MPTFVVDFGSLEQITNDHGAAPRHRSFLDPLHEFERLKTLSCSRTSLGQVGVTDDLKGMELEGDQLFGIKKFMAAFFLRILVLEGHD